MDPCGAAGAACCRRKGPHITFERRLALVEAAGGVRGHAGRRFTLGDAEAAQRVHAQSRRDGNLGRPRQDVGGGADKGWLVVAGDDERDEGTIVGEWPRGDSASQQHPPADAGSSTPRSGAPSSRPASSISVHGGRRFSAGAESRSIAGSAGPGREASRSIASSRSLPRRPQSASSVTSSVGGAGGVPRQSAVHGDGAPPVATRGAVLQASAPPPWSSGTPEASAQRCRRPVPWTLSHPVRRAGAAPQVVPCPERHRRAGTTCDSTGVERVSSPMEPGRAGGASPASSEAAHLRLGARIAPGEGRAENPGTRDSSPAGRGSGG